MISKAHSLLSLVIMLTLMSFSPALWQSSVRLPHTPPIALAPTSALYLGYDLGLQNVANKKDYLYSFTSPTDTEFMANIKWHDVNSGTVPATQDERSVMINYANEWALGSGYDFMTHNHVIATTGNQAAYDLAKESRVTEWPSGISISRSVPDPATLVFFGLSLVGIGVVRWREVFTKKVAFKSMLQRKIYALVSSSGARNL